MMGCRRLHQITNLRPYVLKAQQLSCFCEECMEERFEGCLNTDHIGKFATRKLKLKHAEHEPARERPDLVQADRATDVSIQARAREDRVPAGRPRDVPVQALRRGDKLPVGKPTDVPVQARDREDPVPAEKPAREPQIEMQPSNKDQAAPVEVTRGQFVAIRLTSLRGRGSWYIGKVLEIRDEHVKVTYLTKTGSYYSWPAVEDVSWQMQDDILCTVSPDINITGTRFKLSLMTSEEDKIIRKFLATNEA
ncbi:uncharacterized protein LOC121408111 [Lytechinus variegatus]|uniref:uncharacterized protein LOC121408111 n=1 Tax=Lytechinus variegatus TaxID=7654 RepID=UPI001BB23CA2|nr:uncharacterized protein LOC121408111 [Lytechinus variegatus]